MEDSKSASLALIAGAVGVAYWWYHLNRSGSNSFIAEPTGDIVGSGALIPANPKSSETGSNLQKLKDFAIRHGLTPGSGLRPGDPGLHGEGRALDVPIPALNDQWKFLQDAKAEGIHVLPEDYTGTRNGARSTGPHWHLSFPELRNGRLVW